MAKRKRKKYLPQAMSEDLKVRFEQLIGKSKIHQKQTRYVDRKYAAISINKNYEHEEDLKL